MNKIETFLAVVAGGLVFGLLYGVLVFNHHQNVERDKYLFEKCQAINAKPNSLFTGGKDYTCGNAAQDKGDK